MSDWISLSHVPTLYQYAVKNKLFPQKEVRGVLEREMNSGQPKKNCPIITVTEVTEN